MNAKQPAIFQLVSPFQMRGDQPQAVERLVEWIQAGAPFATLLGVTGSGKTFTMANLIARLGRPVLVVTHNKTLAAQLYSEFKEFFPHNAVEYFVSYYDYYQPEAYIPTTDQYIEKDSDINEEIDRFRHAATAALFTRRDVLIVASVSCIYGLGSPEDYAGLKLHLKRGSVHPRQQLVRELIEIQYSRNDMDFHRSRFRARGETIDIFPASSEQALRVKFFGDEIERIERFDPLTGEMLASLDEVSIFPAQHYVTPKHKREAALQSIEAELRERVAWFESQKKLVEAQRLQERTRYDLEMMRETGTCKGIENYSRHLAGRQPGEAPDTLIDYLPKDCLIILDESHMTVPQFKGMCHGDRSRKQTLVDYGFRLPSALDNRPLTFEEFLARQRPLLFVSATPGPWELEQSGPRVVEQLIRPTGLLDPRISVVPTAGQIDHLLARIRERIDRGERVLVTTLTKRMAMELATWLTQMDVPARYLHDEIDTLERIEILRDLRQGVFSVLVGINLLREGLDLPEVSLVAILDADKEGFLRSAWALIQTCGRAARNVNGEVILYADRITPSMQKCIEETERRRRIQEEFNRTHGIEPTSIVKKLPSAFTVPGASSGEGPARLAPDRLTSLIEDLKKEMEQAAAALQFERAALIRDEIIALQEEHLEQGVLSNLRGALKAGREKGQSRRQAMRRGPAARAGSPPHRSRP
ncbi:MAG: Excinuclease ABC subunit B [Candidatus Ozemobacter sibiricus]|jgi:excinuclease ABC subunit B|uniref:UvrABC system protein B n=1 Tax=Candidatus Ozemobacter sibiricus TaxID=2268124 RepID=A0A367ZW59_9BACT|nr:MAG: Excinuclease ABC subunit B [Candidatus Ozemobacter sibiricus]